MTAKTLKEKMPTAEEIANIIPVRESTETALAKPEPKQEAPKPDPEVDLQGDDHDPVMTTSGRPAPPILTAEVAPEPKKKPPARRTNGRASAAGPTAATKALQKMLPSNVRIHVNKRSRAGTMSFIGDYSANDVTGSGSMERFIKEHIVPEYGYGEFALYLQRPNKAELEPVATVSIEEPLSHRNSGASNDTKELVELFMQQAANSREEAKNRKSPAEELVETLAMLKSMGLAGNEEKSSMDPMMMMMMMQMQQRSAAPAGPDPLMLKIIERLDRQDDDRFHPGMMPLPPPPPPPTENNSMEGFAMIMKAMSDQNAANTALLIKAMENRAAPRDPVADLATLTKLTAAGDDRLTTKDFLTLLPTLKTMISPDAGKNSITDALETMRTMKVLEREFTPQHDPNAEQAAGFWDFLKSFVSSDAAGRIAERVLAQENAQKIEARHDQRRKLATDAADAATRQPPVAQPQEQPAEEEQGVGIPDSFIEHSQRINNAATADERLKVTLQGFQHLATYPDFRKYIAPIFGLAKQNRRIECLDFTGRFLGSLVEAEAVNEEAAIKFLEDLNEHWVIVRSELGMPDIEEVYPDGYEPEEEEEPEEGSSEASGEYELDEDPPGTEIEAPTDEPRDPMRDVVTPHRQVRSQILGQPEPEIEEEPALVDAPAPAG